MTESEYFLEIRHATGKVERHALQGRVTLGANAGIAVEGASHLAPEQLELVPSSGGCWVANGADLPVMTMLDGALFEKGIVPWGKTLELGSLELAFKQTDARKPKRTLVDVRTRIVGGGVATALLVVAIIMLSRGSSQASADGAEAPSLFAIPASCPPHADPALHGEAVFREADSRAERYPYAVDEGVAAALRYRIAAACFEVAERPDHQREAKSAADKIEVTINSDYAVEQVSLRRALDSDDAQAATRSVQALLRYTSHLREDPYVTNLDNVRRSLQRQLSQAESMEKL